MKKQNFITLVMGTASTLALGIGMCMCLLPEWGVLKQGVVVGCAGLALLFSTLLVHRKMRGMPPIAVNLKTIGTALFGILSALVFGSGMYMCMLLPNLFLQGIALGCVGIFMLLGLIPLCKGLQ